MYARKLQHPYGPPAARKSATITNIDAWQITQGVREFSERLHEYALTEAGQCRAQRFADRDYERAIIAWEAKNGRSWATQRQLIECDLVS